MKSYHPLIAFVYFISELLLTMLLRDPVIMATSLFGAVLYASAFATKATVTEDLRFFPILFVLVTLTNPVFSHNGVTPLFFLNGNAVTLESLLYGAFIAAALIAVLLWSRAYAKIVTSDKFLYLFGRALPKTALILSVSLRYLPLIRKDAAALKEAGRTLGLYSTDSFVDRFLSNVKVYYALIGRTLENAVGTAESMRARGWGSGKNIPFASYRWRSRDTAAAVVLLLLLPGVLFPVFLGAMTAAFYPALTLPPPGALTALCYGSFGLLSVFPSLSRWEVSIRWTLFQSKI